MHISSKNAFLGFAGIITAVAAWNIWGGEMFPAAPSADDQPKASGTYFHLSSSS